MQGEDQLYEYFLFFKLNDNCMSLRKLLQFLFQKVYGITFFTKKQFEELGRKLTPFLERDALKAVQVIIFNIITFFRQKHEQETNDTPFYLSNVYVNMDTLQVSVAPLNIIQQSVIDLTPLLEFNFLFCAPECMLSCIGGKSVVWSLGILCFTLLSLLKMSSVNLQEDNPYADLQPTLFKMLDYMKQNLVLTNDIIAANAQVAKQQNSKFNPLENELGL